MNSTNPLSAAVHPQSNGSSGAATSAATTVDVKTRSELDGSERADSFDTIERSRGGYVRASRSGSHLPAQRERSSTYDAKNDNMPEWTVPDLVFSNSLGLWYDDDLAEKEFVAHEFRRCKFRFLAFTLVAFVVTLTALASLDLNDGAYGRMVLIAGIIQMFGFMFESVLQLLRWRSAKKKPHGDVDEDHPVRSATTSDNNDDDDRELSAHISVTNRVPTIVPRTSSTEFTLSRLHEILTFIITVTGSVVSALTYRTKQSRCKWVSHYQDLEDDQLCPYRIYGYFFIVNAVPLLIGQPRFFFVITNFVIACITLLASVENHNTTLADQVLIFIVHFAALVFYGLVKFQSEFNSRHRFEVHWKLTSHTNEVARKALTLKEFILNITPRYLHHRLNNPAESAMRVDVSKQAFCLVVEIRSLARFMTSKLPAQSAKDLGTLFYRIGKTAERNLYHHIRSIGDRSYYVCNLFQTDTALNEQAAQNGTGLALKVTDNAAPLFTLTVGLCCDFLVGMPLGSTCVRYDIFGPSLLNAELLAANCDGGEVAVCKTVAEHLGTWAVFATDRNMDESFRTTEAKIVIACASTAGVSADGNSNPGQSTESYKHSREVSIDSDNSVATVQQHMIFPTSTSSNTNHHLQQRQQQDKDASQDLKMESVCCCCTRFHDPSTEEESVAMYRGHYRSTFKANNAFFCGFLVLLVVCAMQERAASSHEVPLTAFLVCVGVAIVGHVALIVAAPTASQQKSPTDETATPADPAGPTIRHFIGFCVCASLAVIGVNLARPSFIGDSVDYLVWLYMFCAMFNGAPL